jgi:type IV secretory pathway VirB2 component (pilin)
MAFFKNIFFALFAVLMLFTAADIYAQDIVEEAMEAVESQENAVTAKITQDTDTSNEDSKLKKALNSANPDTVDKVKTVVQAVLDPTSIPQAVAPGSVWGVVCSIRLFVCGKVAVVIIAIAVFTLGMLIIAKKLRWPYAIMMVGFISIFAAPEFLVGNILRGGFFGLEIPVLSDALALFAHLCTCTVLDALTLI